MTIGILVVGALTALAARTLSETPGLSSWEVGADLLVGLVFVTAAALTPGSLLMGIVVAGVGLTWLLGSWLPYTDLLHLGMLAIALIVFPGGRPTGLLRWALVALALPVGLGFVTQPGVALLFSAIAVVSLIQPRSSRVRAWYPGGSALGVAFFIVGSWVFSRLDPDAFNPPLAVLIFEALLIAIAIGFPIAARAALEERRKLAEVVLGDDAQSGLDGLTRVLANTLDDPGLEVYLWTGVDSGYQTAAGTAQDRLDQTRRLLEIDDAGRTIAAVASSSTTLSDPATAEPVASAVRLTVQHLQLEAGLQAQLADLEAARGRLLAAADRQRQEMALRLRDEILTNLGQATTELRDVRAKLDNAEAKEALTVAFDELSGAQSEVVALVSGIPPAKLGDGRLGAALSELAGRSAIPVDLSVSADATAGPDAETALFYVCSEALTNAVKHAGAERVEVTLEGGEHTIGLRVSDDGRGGADPNGSGLQGLSDRLAVNGGQLRVVSPPGAGTTVTAVLPR